VKIRQSKPVELEALLDIWLRSVRATHAFLTESDIQALLPIVRDHALPNLELWVLCSDDSEPIGFMGVSEGSIDALFIAPEHLRRGGGRVLVEHARRIKGTLRVDVNEQNPEAIKFYLANGFQVAGRSPVDDGGRPFPLLHMREGKIPALMPHQLTLRKAELGDRAAIAGFNRAMALETEGKALIPELIAAGVQRLLNQPSLGFYLVAERDGKVVGCLMVTHEWSDWRNGLFWWIQSVYVEPASRRQGVYRRLYDFIRELVQADPGVCGFRLYVEKENAVAQKTYGSLGMAQTDYLLYEELKPGVRYFQEPD